MKSTQTGWKRSGLPAHTGGPLRGGLSLFRVAASKSLRQELISFSKRRLLSDSSKVRAASKNMLPVQLTYFVSNQLALAVRSNHHRAAHGKHR